MKKLILLMLCLMVFIAQANAFLLTGAKSIGEGKSDIRLAVTREFVQNMTNVYFDRFNLIYDLNLLQGLDMQAILGYNNLSVTSLGGTLNGPGWGVALKKELGDYPFQTSLYLRFQGNNLTSISPSGTVYGTWYRSDADLGLIFSKKTDSLEPYASAMIKSYNNTSNGITADTSPGTTMEYILGLNYRPQEGIKFAVEFANEVQQTKNYSIWNNNQLSASLSFSR